MLRRLLITAGFVFFLALPATCAAQDNNHALNHGEVGAYGDLFRVAPSGAPAVNYLGLGGRIGFHVNPWVALEGELNYDFEQNYTTVQTNGGTTSGASTTITAKVRPITGLFGPKFQIGASHAVRAFIVGKVGFIDFSTGCNAPAGSPSCFTGSLSAFGGSSTHFSAFPGGGVEFFGGPIGLRVEAGDQMWWNNGTNNNLRVTFGPTIRF